MVRKGAVEFGIHVVKMEGKPIEAAGTTRPPMPLAVSATTFSGRNDDTSTNERTWSTYPAACPARSSRRCAGRVRTGKPSA